MFEEELLMEVATYETKGNKYDREYLIQLPFTNKLWIFAELDIWSFVKWGNGGNTIIILDNEMLGNYLKSEQSIFKENDVIEFFQMLNNHGFHNVTNDNLDVIEFRNNCFGRYQLEYFGSIVDKTVHYKPDKKWLQRQQYDASSRMGNDYCFSVQGTFTHLQIILENMRTDLQLKSANYMLGKSLEKETDIGMPLPSNLFKNPAESQTIIDKSITKYAGYHGDTTLPLEPFYGEALPTYKFEEHGEHGSTIYASKSLADLDYVRPRRGGRVIRQAELQNNVPSSNKQRNMDDYDAAWKQIYKGYTNIANVGIKTENNNTKVELDDDDDDEGLFESDVEPIEQDDDEINEQNSDITEDDDHEHRDFKHVYDSTTDDEDLEET